MIRLHIMNDPKRFMLFLRLEQIYIVISPVT